MKAAASERRRFTAPPGTKRRFEPRRRIQRLVTDQPARDHVAQFINKAMMITSVNPQDPMLDDQSSRSPRGDQLLANLESQLSYASDFSLRQLVNEVRLIQEACGINGDNNLEMVDKYCSYLQITREDSLQRLKTLNLYCESTKFRKIRDAYLGRIDEFQGQPLLLSRPIFHEFLKTIRSVQAEELAKRHTENKGKVDQQHRIAEKLPNLKKSEVTNESGTGESQNCGICQGSLDDPSEMFPGAKAETETPPCQHTFHRACMDAYRKSTPNHRGFGGWKNQCPLCKADTRTGRAAPPLPVRPLPRNRLWTAALTLWGWTSRTAALSWTVIMAPARGATACLTFLADLVDNLRDPHERKQCLETASHGLFVSCACVGLVLLVVGWAALWIGIIAAPTLAIIWIGGY